MACLAFRAYLAAVRFDCPASDGQPLACVPYHHGKSGRRRSADVHWDSRPLVEHVQEHLSSPPPSAGRVLSTSMAPESLLALSRVDASSESLSSAHLDEQGINRGCRGQGPSS